MQANGEGSIYPRRNGSAAYVWLRAPTGQRRRKHLVRAYRACEGRAESRVSQFMAAFAAVLAAQAAARLRSAPVLLDRRGGHRVVALAAVAEPRAGHDTFRNDDDGDGRPGEVDEPGLGALEADRGRAAPSVAVLVDDQVRFPGPWRLGVVEVLTVDQDRDVRVVIDAA